MVYLTDANPALKTVALLITAVLVVSIYSKFIHTKVNTKQERARLVFQSARSSECVDHSGRRSALVQSVPRMHRRSPTILVPLKPNHSLHNTLLVKH